MVRANSEWWMEKTEYTGAVPSAGEMIDLASRMAGHVLSLGGPAKVTDEVTGEKRVVCANGAWSMMLDAANMLRAISEQHAVREQRVQSVSEALHVACIASCTCDTKTPDHRFHEEGCNYKLFQLAIDDVEALR